MARKKIAQGKARLRDALGQPANRFPSPEMAADSLARPGLGAKMSSAYLTTSDHPRIILELSSDKSRVSDVRSEAVITNQNSRKKK